MSSRDPLAEVASKSTPEEPATASTDALGSFFDNILTPGSSLNPTFLLIVDIALATLLACFISLLVLTHSIHFIVLIFITCALWGSVKWFVSELNAANAAEQAQKEQENKKVE